MSRRLALVLRRLVLWSERGAPRGLSVAIYEAVLRSVSLYLRGGRDSSATAYARGSLGSGSAVYGYSDIDLGIVCPDDASRPGSARALVHRRWQRLCRLLPPLRHVVEVAVYEQAELREASTSSTLLAGDAVHLSSCPAADEAGLRIRPGLDGPRAEWRLLGGPERRAEVLARSAQERRIAAWLELQFIWRSAFWGCVTPTAPTVPYLCVKCVADPVRIWLWLVQGRQVHSRREALELGLQEIPEEEQALREALRLLHALGRSPELALARMLPFLVSLSARLGARVRIEIEAAGTTEAQLLWDPSDELALPAQAGDRLRGLTPGGLPSLLPLADWRARVWPLYPDDAFTPVPHDPASPTAIAAAARAAGDYGPYAAMRADGLLVLPGPALLRAVQCPATDPVSFALIEGRATARFPNVSGWSAQDSARRAVVEHRAWLGARSDGTRPIVVRWMSAQARTMAPDLQTLGRLLTAAQAALFLEGVEANEPVLPVTTAASARTLDVRLGDRGAVAVEAYAHYRDCRSRGRSPSARLVAALRDRVLRLPAYAFETPWSTRPSATRQARVEPLAS